jgi:hypothetical protein
MKQHPIKPVLLLFLCVLVTYLLAVPVARANVQAQKMAFASDVVEERVNCLITFLKQKKDMQIPDDFKTVSGLQKEISQIGRPGIVVEAEDAERALNKAAKELLNKLLQQLAEDTSYRNIVVALLQSVDELPEGFCQPEAYETGKDLLVTGRDLNDDRERYKKPIVVQPTNPDHPVPPIPPIPPIPDNWNFIYYGKGYLLPTAVVDGKNGILFLSSDYFHSNPGNTLEQLDAYPPFIAPLWIMSHDGSPSFQADEGGNFPSVDQVFDPPTVTGTSDFFRYAYNTAKDAPTAPFSSTLYTNPDSNESDWILFSYGNVQLPYDQYQAFVGLVPGDGSENHPGPGQPRGLAPVDLSEESGERIYDDTTDYLWIYEMFNKNGDSQDQGFDLADHFLIFRPDGDNKYTVTAGTRDMVVDSLGLDEKETSLDMAIINLRDPDLLARVDGEEFVVGPPFPPTYASNDAFPGIENWPIRWDYKYKYGLQTVGQNSEWGGFQIFTDFNTLNTINGNGLLAYAVQVEEDRVNEKIIEIARDADAMKLRVETIKNQLQCDDIRARDALFAQEADAQAGRVTRDRNGNWVRAQQYILRPDNKTVQVLNVALRGQDAGDLAGLSTMDFTTTFKQEYQGDLRSLPWGGWLGTQTDGKVKWINTDYSSPDLDQMYVKFTNPSGEYLKESRWFGEKAYCLIHQFVMGEELELSSLKNGMHSYGYHYTDVLSDPELYPTNKVLLPEGSYGVEKVSGAGFNYTFAGDSKINVAFFKLDDYGNDPVEAVDLADMWDALRVNEDWWGSPNIGDNNLEIAVDREANYFDKPIDVVYIPMSRMLWKNKESNNYD